MFENNTDINFGDEFTTDLSSISRSASNKRPSESPRRETPKKQKIAPLPINAVKRRFPGPAGILPDRKNTNSALLESPGAKTPEEIPCSQMSLSIFHGSPWIDTFQDFEPLIDLYDIAWIKTNARLKTLQNQKAPFLAAVIKNIESSEGKHPVVKVLLKDVGGEIQGTILNTLYAEYAENLVAGAVIVLRQCGVISCSDKHFLTILPNNLVAIYRQRDDKTVVDNVQDVSCDDLMRKLNCGGPSASQDREDVGRSRSDATSVDEVWKDVLQGVDMDTFFEDF